MARTTKKARANNGANLGFEARRFAAADKPRGSLDASEHKQLVLGLISLKGIQDAFDARKSSLNSRVRTALPTC